jgi:hypothetical protein
VAFISPPSTCAPNEIVGRDLVGYLICHCSGVIFQQKSAWRPPPAHT